jgi:hypothetical protein
MAKGKEQWQKGTHHGRRKIQLEGAMLEGNK